MQGASGICRYGAETGASVWPDVAPVSTPREISTPGSVGEMRSSVSCANFWPFVSVSRLSVATRAPQRARVQPDARSSCPSTLSY